MAEICKEGKTVKNTDCNFGSIPSTHIEAQNNI